MFVSKEQALTAARDVLINSIQMPDPLLRPWAEASLGIPVMVSNVFRQPSYWLVPVMIQGKTGGFIRVLGNGQVGAFGALYRDPSNLDNCPELITGISAETAKKLAKTRIKSPQQETISEPIFVHDGPPGREAWLVEITRNNIPIQWIFITDSGLYERSAGKEIGGELE